MFIQRISFIVAAIALCMPTVHAQQKEKLTIEHATVFLNGAELTNKTTIKLPAGKSEIMFTNIAGNINTKSLNVGATNSVLIQSAVFQKNYLTEKKVTQRAQELQDSIEYLTDIRNDIYYDQQVAEKQISILNQNKELYGEQTGVSVTELQKMLTLIKEQLKPLMKERTKKTDMLTKLDSRINNMRQQQREEMQKDELPGGIVLVTFYSKRATTTDITVTYVTPNAGWTPSYDLRVNSINEPIDLTYKAHVHQSTGISWDKVALTLSGGNPNEGAQAPKINPWYLTLGYLPPQIDADMPSNRNLNTAPGVYQKADGENLSIGGARSDGTLYYVDGVQVMGSRGINMSQSSINNYTTARVEGINTRFEIDIPYTIPSDGKTHNVSIKNYQLPASYRYYTIPKIDKDVFLQAEITNSQDYNLLSGTTNVFFENTYIGQGLLDTKNVDDTMYISLGRDKKVIVAREQDKKFRSKKTIGTKVREQFAYKTNIRNTRKEAIQIVVIDQIPVSINSAITIEDIDIGEALLDKNKGTATWTININPNETKEIKLNYTVKYPKGEFIENL